MRPIRAAVMSRLIAGAGMREQFALLDRHRQLDAPEARQDIARRMLAQLRYFASRPDTLPEWQRAAALEGIDELWAAWQELPVVGKADLRSRFHPRRILEVADVKGVASSTGGSTGEPSPFLHDTRARKALRAADWYCKLQLGWRPGVPIVCLWGSDRDVGKARSFLGLARGFVKDFHIVDSYRPSAAMVDRTLALIERKKPVAMYGFTSLLEFVAREAVKQGYSCPPGAVTTAWNGGEMLFDHQVDAFRAAFGVPILTLYGGRELGAMAFQPSPGAPMTVLRPLVFVELLGGDGREGGPGAPGRLVVTSLVNRGTPFLRYEVGDLATYTVDGRDDSGIRALDRLLGRSASVLALPNGARLHTLFWNHLFKDYPEVEQFQVAVRDGGVEVRLKGQGFGEDRERQLRQVLDVTLEGNAFDIRWLEELRLTAQGKLLQVIDERATPPRGAGGHP